LEPFCDKKAEIILMISLFVA